MVERELIQLMKHAISGTLEKWVRSSPEKFETFALRNLGRIGLIMFAPGDANHKWHRLYELVPVFEQTRAYKKTCRKFAKEFTRNRDQEMILIKELVQELEKGDDLAQELEKGDEE